MDSKPKLRQLNVIPFEEDGQPAFCLKDHSGICPSMMLLTPVGLFLASLCDGTRTLADVRAAFKQQFGEDIPEGQLEGLLERLDEGLMLESERFREHRAARVKAFMEAPVRPASHAGTAYPKSVSALQRRLNGFFTHGDGPGPVGEAAADSSIVAVAAPHIDFERGGPAYAHAYKELVEHWIPLQAP